MLFYIGSLICVFVLLCLCVCVCACVCVYVCVKSFCKESLKLPKWPHLCYYWGAPYILVFSPNAGKYGLEKTPYLDTFHAVHLFANLNSFFIFVTVMISIWDWFLHVLGCIFSYDSMFISHTLYALNIPIIHILHQQ